MTVTPTTAAISDHLAALQSGSIHVLRAAAGGYFADDLVRCGRSGRNAVRGASRSDAGPSETAMERRKKDGQF